MVKDPSVTAGDVKDVGSIPGSERPLRGGHGNPLQYYCLENPMDRGAWQATVHRVTQSQTCLRRLSMHACMQDKIKCFSVDPDHLSLTHNSSTVKKRWLLDGSGQLVTTARKNTYCRSLSCTGSGIWSHAEDSSFLPPQSSCRSSCENPLRYDDQPKA